MRALADEKLHTMQLMVEQEKRNVDQLRQELAASSASATSAAAASKTQTDLDSAARRLSKMQEQLEALKKVGRGGGEEGASSTFH